jgi:hypothetical protein
VDIEYSPLVHRLLTGQYVSASPMRAEARVLRRIANGRRMILKREASDVLSCYPAIPWSVAPVVVVKAMIYRYILAGSYRT